MTTIQKNISQLSSDGSSENKESVVIVDFSNTQPPHSLIVLNGTSLKDFLHQMQSSNLSINDNLLPTSGTGLYIRKIKDVQETGRCYFGVFVDGVFLAGQEYSLEKLIKEGGRTIYIKYLQRS